MSRAFPLLAPMRYKFICALGPERFELRTAGLGCQVSTITFLTSIITIFCTLLGVVVLYGLAKLFSWVSLLLRANRGGCIQFEDGSVEIWDQRGSTWGQWWRCLRGKERENEYVRIDGDPPKAKRVIMNGRRGHGVRHHDPETRPLLEQ